MPENPRWPVMVAKCRVKTLPVLFPPALAMSQMASARKTRISNRPRMVPTLALTRMPQ